MVVSDLALSWYCNNKHVLRFTVTDDDTVGSPAKDITGKYLKFALTKIVNGQPATKSTSVLIEKETGTGIVTTDGPNGICEVTVLDTDTENLKPGDYYFELELFEPGPSDGLVIATGTATLLPNVVNP